MKRVAIVTDSCADIPPAVVSELGITIVPLQVIFGEKSYRDGFDLSTDEFYRMLTSPEYQSVHPKTSQPSIGAFEDAYERLLKDTDEILVVTLSASLSGTYNSATLAIDRFAGKARIDVVDTRQASLGHGLIAISCAKMAQAGASLDEIGVHAREMSSRVRLYFAVETLEFLQRGGRIGRAQAFFGGLLSIKPILKVEEGEVRPAEKVRTRKKALNRLVELALENLTIESAGILQATTIEDAEMIRDRLAQVHPQIDIIISQVGPVIGTHTGPGVIGIVVVREK